MSQPIDTASVKIVPDFSEFDDKARTGITRGLKEVASEARAAFGQVERAAGAAAAEVAADFRRGGAVAESAIKQVGNESVLMAGKVSASSAEAGSALGSRISSGALAAKAAILGIGFAVTAGLGALTTFGLRSAASLEQTQIGFEGLLGSAEAATAQIRELQEFAAATPFEFGDLADSARRLLGSGVATQDALLPTLTTLGDIVSATAGTQENINGLIRAFGQIASKGRVMGGEILQISEQLPGFNSNQALAAHLGVSVAEALRLQEAGAIDAQTGIAALLEGMQQFPGAAGAMERQSQTLIGVFSTFKDTIGIALSDAFAPVIPSIKEALADVTPILGEAIGQLAPLLGTLLATVLPLVASLIQALVPILNPILDALRLTVEALAPALQPLGEALGAIVGAIAPLVPVIAGVLTDVILALVPVIAGLVPKLQEMVPAIIALIPAFGDVLIALVPLLPALFDLVTAITPLTILLAPLVADLLSLLAVRGLVPVVNALASGIEFLAGGFGDLVGWLQAVNWAEVLGAITGAVSGAFNAVVGFFQDLPSRVGRFLSELPSRAANALNQMAFVIGLALGRTIIFFRDLPVKVVAAIADLAVRLAEAAASAGAAFGAKLRERFDAVVAFVRGIPSRMLDALRTMIGAIGTFASEIIPRLVQLGRDIVGGIVRGIRATIGNVGRALWDGVRSGVSGLIEGLGIGSPSKLMADEVGRWLPAGISQGVQQGSPGLLNTVAAMVGDIAAITGRGGVTSSLNVNVGGVVVNGAATFADAQTVGNTVARSVAAAGRRTAVALAVRMR